MARALPSCDRGNKGPTAIDRRSLWSEFKPRSGSPIDHRVDEGSGLTNRIQLGGADADRDRSSFSHGPSPTAREAHFGNRKSDATMFHG
jgi:hypothetical protein